MVAYCVFQYIYTDDYSQIIFALNCTQVILCELYLPYLWLKFNTNQFLRRQVEKK
jgi:hypothetical protein